jgi:methylenetetrahydrofolate dehydrogenase (NADP+)/methenyltetrahydrofolate cyclohydrolase
MSGAESGAAPHSTGAVQLNYNDIKRYYSPNNHGPRGLPDDGVRGRLIDGKAISSEVRSMIRADIEQRRADPATCGRAPGLVVVLVGSDPASKVYIKQKQTACQEVGIKSTLLEMPEETSPAQLLATIRGLNEDEACDGILVQLPLPTPQLQEEQSAILETIRTDKDVDGFHPFNLGRLVTREPNLRPCTPFGVMHLLWSTGVNPYGLRCVVVGASNHVGRPMMLELLLNGASVQIVHRFTQDLEAVVRDAECLIVACGKPGLVKGDWVRPGAIVIDVGINRLESGKLVGDVDFETAKQHASWITPVPGGVGPMTVAMLLRNTVTAYDTHTNRGAAA